MVEHALSPVQHITLFVSEILAHPGLSEHDVTSPLPEPLHKS